MKCDMNHLSSCNWSIEAMKYMKSAIFVVMTGMLTSMLANATPTVTFQGEVSDQTCQASINGGTDGVVLLPTVPANSLDSAGKTAGLTPFTISVKDCTAPAADMPIKTKFLGHAVTSNGNLGNVASGTDAATNVAIQLTESASGADAIVLNGPTSVAGLVLKSGQDNASYDFGVRYISENGGATAGVVTSLVEYTLSYQ